MQPIRGLKMELKNMFLWAYFIIGLLFVASCGDNSSLQRASLEPDLNTVLEATPNPTLAGSGGGSVETISGIKMKTQISNQFSTTKICNQTSNLCMSAGIVR
jgi:hypothetical protein